MHSAPRHRKQMLGPFHHAPRAAFVVTLACLALTALVAISTPAKPAQQVVEEATCDGTNAMCGGRTWEKLICDDPIKATKCFDAEVTCHSWDVCDCCSPVPLHKCLSPMAGRAFDSDCSSPVDAREECCGDAFTHLRAFQALADLQEDVVAAVDSAEASVSAATAAATEAAAAATAAAAGAAEAATTAATEAITEAGVMASEVSEAVSSIAA